MTYYLTGNDFKCHLNLSDVHATGPYTAKSLREGSSKFRMIFRIKSKWSKVWIKQRDVRGGNKHRDSIVILLFNKKTHWSR